MSDASLETSPRRSGFGGFLLVLFAAALATFLLTPAETPTGVDEAALAEARVATGGAQTREDIMARQAGIDVDTTFRRDDLGNPGAAAGIDAQLGTLGGVSDSEMFRALRYNEADVTVSSRAPASEVLIQDTGMQWQQFRAGTLSTFGTVLMLGTIAALALFYVVRGRVRIDGPRTGQTILRFNEFERFAHWLMAISFIVLALTGMITFFGRSVVIPIFGHEAYAPIALASKWVHNNVAWPFMLSIAIVFVLWVWHNIPGMIDVRWMAKGGGLFTPGVHPPAKKFNAGQKVIFWSCVLIGGSISLSGMSLLFPFELPMFAKTFGVLNMTGLPELLGFGVLPETMLPHREMQLAQAWHTIVAFVFMAIVIAHIYIGSVGMEGAFDAMGNGHVDAQWAKEHHSIWFEEHADDLDPLPSRGKGTQAPAE